MEIEMHAPESWSEQQVQQLMDKIYIVPGQGPVCSFLIPRNRLGSYNGTIRAVGINTVGN